MSLILYNILDTVPQWTIEHSAYSIQPSMNIISMAEKIVIIINDHFML